MSRCCHVAVCNPANALSRVSSHFHPEQTQHLQHKSVANMSNAKTSSRSATFHPFPRLPPEIRGIIWRATIEPRLVYLRKYVERVRLSDRVWSDKSIDDELIIGLPFLPMQYSFASPSTLLIPDVCHEAREVIQKTHSKAFGSSTSSPRTWFDFELDTLYLDWRCANHYRRNRDAFGPWDIGTSDTSKVSRLALLDGNGSGQNPWIYPYDNYTRRWLHKRVLPQFSCLKTLTLADSWANEISSECHTDLVEMDDVYGVNDVVGLPASEEYRPWLKAQINACHDLAKNQAIANAYCDEEELKVLHDHSPTRNNDGLLVQYAIPNISYRTITARHMAEDYFLAKRSLDASKPLYRMKIGVVSAERAPLFLAVPETITMTELVERYRKSKAIPSNWEFSAIYEVGNQQQSIPLESTIFDRAVRNATNSDVLIVAFADSWKNGNEFALQGLFELGDRASPWSSRKEEINWVEF